MSLLGDSEEKVCQLNVLFIFVLMDLVEQRDNFNTVFPRHLTVFET
jgi:hypothetical protein